MRTLISLLGLSLLSVTASAADTATPPPTAWAGTVSAGYIRTSGNTSTSAANLKFELDYTDLPWRNELTGSAGNGRTGNDTTAEQYALGDKLKFNFDEVDYVFGNVSYDNDRFAGISQNFSESVGYGRRLLMTEHQTLDAEVGAGVSEQKPVGESGYDVQPIATLGGKYVYKFSPTSEFSQSLRTEIGSKNTLINPVTQLKLNIVGALFATLNYDLRYNTTVPENSHHTDIITSVNFGYSFGKKP
jgi:putative salt-induced outer membrane protein